MGLRPFLLTSARGSTFRRRNLTSKVGPRTERDKHDKYILQTIILHSIALDSAH